MASAALELVEHRFARAEVTLGGDVAAALPRVACDRKLFEQVLVNLLLNACDACERGGHVVLGVHCNDSGARVLFVVTDDGIGITAEACARATEPFFTTKGADAGTGLGLAIANEIVKHHHGELTLAPREGGRGTRATVDLAAVREGDRILMPDEQRGRVFVVDDDRALAETLSDGLVDRGFDAVPIASSKEAARRLASEDIDALVTDLRMPGIDGLGLLELSRRSAPARPVIVMTAYSAVDSAIESIRQGAYHYLTKPFKVDELALFLERALDEAKIRREAVVLRRALRDQFALANVIGSSDGMRELCDLASRVADATTPVLVLGETGTGKGLIARAVHAAGPRASGPFVTLNCAAVPENFLESELFGHTKGAFTGATGPRKGLFEQAAGGTLFLDEIGEMPLTLQAKLLDVLERWVVRALGSDRERAVDVRVIAATHRNLKARVREGTFREDLLFRLDIVRLEVPPLRQRPKDLPLLATHFLARAKARHPSSPVERIGNDAFARLTTHAWPGNVRELENVIERVVLLGRTAEAHAADLPNDVGAIPHEELPFAGAVLTLEELDRRYARWAIAQLGGRKMLTAEKLGIDRKTLSRLLAMGEEDPTSDG